jgi:hypothetical protein
LRAILLILCNLLFISTLIGCSDNKNSALLKENEMMKTKVSGLEQELVNNKIATNLLEDKLKQLTEVTPKKEERDIFNVSNEKLLIVSNSLTKDEITIENVKKLLGKPISMESYEGVSGTYEVVSYSGVEFTFMKDSSIKWYKIKKSQFETSRGISIGASKEEVFAAYSKNYSNFYEENGSLIYGDKTGVTFQIEDEKVKEIHVRFDYE